MEDPPKHRKNNKKSMPLTINIRAGAGSFGIGGIVLFGGALVTATLVSALAVKTRRQRRSSSDPINKSMSPSPEPRSVDAPNELELMMKINKDLESSKDFSIDSPLLHLRDPSDGITNTEEMQTKPIQNLIPDEKQNFGMAKDENGDSRDGNEDSVATDKEIKNGCEKVQVEDCEEQVAVAAQSVVGFQSSAEESDAVISVMSGPKDDGGGEQRYSMPIDDENNHHTEKPLISNEALTTEEDEAIEGVREEDQNDVKEEESIQYETARDITVEAASVQVPLEDDVAEEEEEIALRHAGDDDETVLMNEIEVEEKPKVQFVDDETIVDNSEEDPINTGFVDEIVMGEEKAMDEKSKDCEDERESIESEEKQQMQCDSKQAVGEEASHHEVAVEDAQETHSSTATAYVMNMNEGLKVPTQMMNKEEDKETAQEVQAEDELVNKYEIPHVESIEEAKDDETRPLMNKEIAQLEMITEDELIEQVKDDDQQVQREGGLVEKEEESKERQMMNKEETCEEVQAEDELIEDELVKKEEERKEDATMESENEEVTKQKIEQPKQDKGGSRLVSSEAWKLKLGTFCALVSVCCLCHCYSDPQLTLVASFIFVFILLGIRNRNQTA